MSRRKTRVTRMSRRKARYGTRKQNGGFLHYLNPLNWFGKKPEVPTNAVGPTAPAPATNPTKPNGPAPAPAPPAADQTGGGRKTRHRRRHHRK